MVVVQTGGKQYCVEENSVIKVEKLDVPSGETILLDRVLMQCVGGKQWKIGAPFITDVTVKAEVLDHGRDKKVIVFKKKRRGNYRRKHGHRQHHTMLRIQAIDVEQKSEVSHGI